MEGIKQTSASPIIFNLDDYTFRYENDREPFKNISREVFLIKGMSFLLGIFLKYFWFKKLRVLKKIQIEAGALDKPVISEMEISIRICYIFLLSKYITHLLKLLRVDQIYQAMYYDNFGLASGLASHNLSLKNHCVQHGGQSENNPAFGSWKVMSDKGYAFLPDYFLCWNEASSRSVDSWCKRMSKHSSKVIGYSWIELWKKKLSKKYNLSSEAINNIPNILITLQPSVDFKNSFVFEFIKTSKLEVNWLLRVHPRQESDIFLASMEEYFIENENIYIKSSTEPLPLLMMNSKLHITFFSSSVYEAKYCDLKSVIIDKRGLDYFPDLLENGDAELALESQKLKEIIQKIL